MIKRLWNKIGSTDNSVPPYLVTKEWLVDSVLKGEKQCESSYIPANSNQDTYTRSKPAILKIGVVFKNTTFSIIKESYSKEEIEDIEHKIQANSGFLVSEKIENSTAKYIVQNDGYHGWKGFDLNKNSQGKYTVSHRFVDECLRGKRIISLIKEKAMDLLPLPYQPPYENMKSLWVAFTLFNNKGKDLTVLQSLAELIGMRVEMTEQNTTHIIVNSDNLKDISKSSKINQVKVSYKNRKPMVVKFDWFLQWLLHGKVDTNPDNILDVY